MPTSQGRQRARPDAAGHEIPATLQDLVMARLDRMEGEREVAQLAATLGREFSYQLLAAVATWMSRHCRPTGQAGRRRRSCTRRSGRLVAPTCSNTHSSKTRLYNALVKGKRQQFHRRIAEVLEAQFPQTVETQPELLAHHFTEAGLPEKAIGYWLKAGLRSRERSANVEAIGHLTKGLALLGTLDESPERDAQELQFLNPLGTAYIAARGYAAPGGRPGLRRARELCERIGQPPQLFAIMWGAGSGTSSAPTCGCAWSWPRGDGTRRTANDPGMLMEALFLPAVTSIFRGDFAAGPRPCTRALEVR